MKDAEINDDHNQHPADFGSIRDEMEARVENDRLASDHAIPTDARQNSQWKVWPETVVAQQHHYRVKYNSQCRRNHAPEIEPVMALKAIEQRDKDFDAVITRNREKAGNYHIDRQRRRDGTCFPGHLGCRRTWIGRTKLVMAQSGEWQEKMNEKHRRQSC